MNGLPTGLLSMFKITRPSVESNNVLVANVNDELFPNAWAPETVFNKCRLGNVPYFNAENQP